MSKSQNNSLEVLARFTHHHGTAHKKAYNFTTIATIPFALWVIYTVFSLRDSSYGEFVLWFQNPLNAVVASLFVCVTFKHFAMELQVVFEDYISDIAKRSAVIIGIKLLFLLVAISTLISLIKIAVF